MKIELNSGREIFLDSICQDRTYGGLLCGYPNKELNERYIKYAMESALEKMNAEVTYLVPPPLLEMEINEKARKHRKDAIRIPYITCYGQQDDFALPIDESVLEHIKTIDWDKEAEGYEF